MDTKNGTKLSGYVFSVLLAFGKEYCGSNNEDAKSVNFSSWDMTLSSFRMIYCNKYRKEHFNRKENKMFSPYCS